MSCSEGAEEKGIPPRWQIVEYAASKGGSPEETFDWRSRGSGTAAPGTRPCYDVRPRKGRPVLCSITEGAMGHVQYETPEGGHAERFFEQLGFLRLLAQHRLVGEVS